MRSGVMSCNCTELPTVMWWFPKISTTNFDPKLYFPFCRTNSPNAPFLRQSIKAFIFLSKKEHSGNSPENSENAKFPKNPYIEISGNRHIMITPPPPTTAAATTTTITKTRTITTTAARTRITIITSANF